jgi:hypothetical protein
VTIKFLDEQFFAFRQTPKDAQSTSQLNGCTRSAIRIQAASSQRSTIESLGFSLNAGCVSSASTFEERMGVVYLPFIGKRVDCPHQIIGSHRLGT